SIAKLCTSKQEWKVFGISSKKQNKEAVNWIKCNFNNLTDIQDIKKALEDQGVKQVDLLVHSAGIFHQDTSLTKYQCTQLVNINLIAPYMLTELLSPFFQKGTKVIFIS